jgi:hypothetical protein
VVLLLRQSTCRSDGALHLESPVFCKDKKLEACNVGQYTRLGLRRHVAAMEATFMQTLPGQLPWARIIKWLLVRNLSWPAQYIAIRHCDGLNIVELLVQKWRPSTPLSLPTKSQMVCPMKGSHTQ